MQRFFAFALAAAGCLSAIPAGAAPEAIKAKAATTVASPNQVSKVELELLPAGKGESRLVLHNGLKQGQVELLKQPLFFTPEVRWHGEDFLEVNTWKTPQEKTSIYYDLMGQRQSVAIPNVLAFGKHGAVAANVDQDKLRLVDIFGLSQAGMYYGGNSIALEAKFPPGRPLLDVIKRAEFTPDGDFMMRYEVGAKVLMGVRVNADQIKFDSE